MNSVVRSLALRALHRLQRPAAAASYSTAHRLAAYRYRSDGGYLLVPLMAVGVGTWLIATAATRYVMTPPRQGRRRRRTTTAVVEGPRPEVVAASPSNQ